MSLSNQIRDLWCKFQGELFPEPQAEVGTPLKNHQRFVAVLEVVCPESFIWSIPQKFDRPEADPVNLVRAFLARAVWDIPTTRALIERLEVVPRLRHLCGWIHTREITSESSFLRTFVESADSDLAGRMHEALIIKETLGQGIVGHVSRDSTAVPAHGKPTLKGESDQKPMKRKRGRPQKGEVWPPKAKTRLERQATGGMTLYKLRRLKPLPADYLWTIAASGPSFR